MKVYFAGNSDYEGSVLVRAGVKYRLKSFFDIYKRRKAERPSWLHFNHMIFDSGLFTLMFGTEEGVTFTEQDALDWQARYVEFIEQAPFGSTFIELDVQKILGAKFAWDLRRNLKARTEAEIMSVWHLEDGDPDSLIRFSDYIGISQPELRRHCSPKERLKITSQIASRAIALGKKVHLLGLTEVDYLKKFRCLDSCDSSTWNTGLRFGKVDSKSLGQVRMPRKSQEETTYWSVRCSLEDYRKYAGTQD